jgi:CheY-like chemotaxis protein
MSASILIIEDNQANIDLMTFLLTAFGHRPLCATDGETGVALAMRAKPDLILCDLHLPRLDGYGVVQRLRAEPLTRDIPVLAASALPVSDGCAELRRAGFSGCLPKSLEPDDLLPMLESFLPSRLRSGAAPAPAGQPAAPAAAPPAGVPGETRASVLLLDAAPENAGLVAAVLAHSGYRVHPASNPAQTGALLDGHTVDLVVCDLGSLDGRRLAFLADALEMAPGLPVLVICPDEQESVAALGAGRRRRVLSQPLEPQQLVAAIGELLA